MTVTDDSTVWAKTKSAPALLLRNIPCIFLTTIGGAVVHGSAEIQTGPTRPVLPAAPG